MIAIIEQTTENTVWINPSSIMYIKHYNTVPPQAPYSVIVLSNSEWIFTDETPEGILARIKPLDQV